MLAPGSTGGYRWSQSFPSSVGQISAVATRLVGAAPQGCSQGRLQGKIIPMRSLGRPSTGRESSAEHRGAVAAGSHPGEEPEVPIPISIRAGHPGPASSEAPSRGSLLEKALEKWFPFSRAMPLHPGARVRGHGCTRCLQTRPSTRFTVIYSSVPLRNIKEDKRVQRTTIILQIIKTLSEKQILPAQSELPLGKPVQASSKKKKSLSFP